jgi:Trk-type K+ transport system membrane component
MRIFRHLRLIALALAVLTIIGTAGFHYIEGWPWFDGFYMAITTFTTIGLPGSSSALSCWADI